MISPRLQRTAPASCSTRYLALLVTATFVVCSDEPTVAPLSSDASLARSSHVDSNSATCWNAETRALVVKDASSPGDAIRNYTLVSLAVSIDATSRVQLSRISG
jgi:hypothetical protein